MLVYRIIAKNVFREFDSNITPTVSDILLLFCTPILPSRHVSENQEYRSSVIQNYVRQIAQKE